MADQQFYRLADYYPGDRPLHAPKPRFMAVKTGEFRPPRKGEWYLSGAIPEAYQANMDYSTSQAYHILRVVEVEHKTVVIIKQQEDQ